VAQVELVELNQPLRRTHCRHCGKRLNYAENPDGKGIDPTQELDWPYCCQRCYEKNAVARGLITIEELDKWHR